MAASAPAPGLHQWNDESQSTLEIGMSGMSLVSNIPEASGRKGTVSTVSTGSPTDDDLAPTPRHYHLLNHADHATGHRNSAPASPHSERHSLMHHHQSQQQDSFVAMKSRPPGPSGHAILSVGNPGHSKNNSATSSMLTLTPNSSNDGNQEWHTRQSSPFHGAPEIPPLPYLNPEYRTGGGVSSDDSSRLMGNFEIGESGEDGLLGLGALRDRAYSSPGPSQSSNSSVRGHFPAHSVSSQFDQQQLQQQHDRARIARERPPLSQSYNDGYTTHQGDRSIGGISMPYSIASSRSTSDANNVSMESSDSRLGFGAIGRPELRLSASEFDQSRLRSGSSDNNQMPYGYQQQHHATSNILPDHIAHKFGTLPSLGSHIQQQRQGETFDMPKPQHTRSASTPLLANTYAQGVSGLEPRHFQGSYLQGDVSYKHSRGGSLVGSAPSSNYEPNQHLLGGSLPTLNGGSSYTLGYSSLQRRSAVDFPYHAADHVVLAAADDIRGYGTSSMISPGQSPLQVHYGGHSRQASDATPIMLSSSPMSNGGLHRGRLHHGHNRHPSAGADDDLAHPLLGEHIEVPADHDDLHGRPHAYIINQTGSIPVIRTASHVHSLSLDQIPSHFFEAPRNLPTAGAALPLPKVMYSVKFKRTQRNFVLGPRITRDLKIGTYVKVEADRGEDLGILVGKIPSDNFSFTGRSSFTAGMGPPGGLGASGAADLKRIIRLATHDEVSLLTLKREEEDELLKICRAKVRQRGLPMNVVDAEYQFDRHKLTFFFEAEGRVDFRELVRDLFSMYKTRIWMQQLDKNTSTSNQAIIAPPSANLQMDFGTPIIAPVSEFADSIVYGGMSGADARSH